MLQEKCGFNNKTSVIIHFISVKCKYFFIKAYHFHCRGLSSRDLENPSYNIYSATVSEVELDVLTGEIIIRRVDILEDTGTSINPEIDVGQLEGAFVMSLGMWLTEQLRYDPVSGKLLTYDTWVCSYEYFKYMLQYERK